MLRILIVVFSLIVTAAGKPNVLFIMVDDLGFGDLSSHGATDLRTPNIDRLMAEGVRFDNAYANCPVCSPTRAAFLTGRYPDMVGVPGVIRTYRQDNWGQLDLRAPTIAQSFKKAGYHTALIGKWHLGLDVERSPNARGFDFFHGWLGDMMDDYYKHRRHDVEYMRKDDQLIKPDGHATDLFTTWACDYVKARAVEEDPRFFLFLAYNAPHTPIQPPADWLEKVRAREPGIGEARAKLVALIEHMDDGIGKVMAALKAEGLAEETLVVFTSDNGGQSNVGANNGANRGGKQEMWEGGLRVPTCVVWPGKTSAGRRLRSVTLTMDWFPTLMDACEIETPAGLDGSSILPDLLGTGEVEPNRTLIWMRREGGMKYGGRVYYAVRRGSWKLLQNTPYEPMQLIDLDRDPLEQRPVGNEQKVVNELSKELQGHVNRSGEIPWQRPE